MGISPTRVKKKKKCIVPEHVHLTLVTIRKMHVYKRVFV